MCRPGCGGTTHRGCLFHLCRWHRAATGGGLGLQFGYLAESIVFECIFSASSLYLSGRSDEGSLMPSEGFSSPISHFLLCLQCVHCEVGFIVSFLFR